jgi:hypothetical protein
MSVEAGAAAMTFLAITHQYCWSSTGLMLLIVIYSLTRGNVLGQSVTARAVLAAPVTATSLRGCYGVRNGVRDGVGTAMNSYRND